MMKKMIALAALTIACLAGAHTQHADARTPLCRDSNGSAPGGSVYLDYYQVGFVCDVVPPQRLHILRTPSNAARLDMGGRYSPAVRICWDVDY